MRFAASDRLVVLTGAGISVESGLATFRGSGGLWNGYRVDQVATPEAWAANRALAWSFYSNRRHEARGAVANAAHRALAAIERQLGERFFLITQNVDDLHERAGSQRVHHMHGSLSQSRCVRCDVPFVDAALHLDPANLPVCATCGEAVRPHIVWFGEVPLELEGTLAHLRQATVFLVIGTSGAVYPAAAFVQIAHRNGARCVYIGPEEPLNAAAFDEVLLGTATEVVPTLLEQPV